MIPCRSNGIMKKLLSILDWDIRIARLFMLLIAGSVPFIVNLYLINAQQLDDIGKTFYILEQLFKSISISTIICLFLQVKSKKGKSWLFLFLSIFVLLGEFSSILATYKYYQLFLLLFYIVFVFVLVYPGIVSMLILIVTIIMIPVDLYALYIYNTVFDVGLLQTILETNTREALEFFTSAIQWMPICIIVLLLTFTIKCLWELSSSSFWERGNKYRYALIAVSFIVFFISSVAKITPNDLQISKSLLYPSVTRLLYVIGKTKLTNDEVKEIFNHLNDKKIDVKVKGELVPNVIFVLGESESRHHMSLYGYDLKTTPFLDELKERKELIAFSDVISPYTLTSKICSNIFNFSDLYDNKKQWYEYNNIIDIANNAGYNTIWLSNQEPGGSHSSLATKVYSDRCTFHRFTSLDVNFIDSVRRPDELLLPLLDDAIKNHSGKNNLYIIHLMGNHFDYRLRYPEQFEVFSSNVEQGDNEEIKRIKAEYDTSVKYNDYVLREIIKRFENTNAVVIYISDHGEDVYDYDNVKGHGNETSPWQHEIPMFIWMSKKFIEANNMMYASIDGAKNNPYSTDLLIHTMIEIMNLETSVFDATKSVVNKKFYIRDRYINGNILYYPVRK